MASKEYFQKYYQEHREKQIEVSKNSYKNNREKRIQQVKEYKEKNRAKEIAYQQEYRSKNAKKAGEYEKQYLADIRAGKRYKKYRKLENMLEDINKKYYYDKLFYKDKVFTKIENEFINLENKTEKVILDNTGKVINSTIEE